MKTATLLIISVACVLFLAYPHYFQVSTMRFRIEVTAQVNGSLRTGASVISITYRTYPDFFVLNGNGNEYPDVEGSAPTVDLGKDGLLFLSFQGGGQLAKERIEKRSYTNCILEDIACMPMAAYRIRSSAPGFYSDERQLINSLARQNGVRDVPLVSVPGLSRFVDDNEPTLVTTSPVDPIVINGDKVSFVKVTIERTQEAVTGPDRSWPEWLRREHRYFGILHHRRQTSDGR